MESVLAGVRFFHGSQEGNTSSKYLPFCIHNRWSKSLDIRRSSRSEARFGMRSMGISHRNSSPMNPTQAVPSNSNHDTLDDVILLNVGGMMCGGCADSVKKLLESQPQVLSAIVDLATETAEISIVPEVKEKHTWKQDLGEKLASHLTTCGFQSSVRG